MKLLVVLVLGFNIFYAPIVKASNTLCNVHLLGLKGHSGLIYESFIMKQDVDDENILYFDENERMKYEVFVNKDGLLVNRKNETIDTKDPHPDFLGWNTNVGVFVMSSDGKIYIFYRRKHTYRHSSFLSAAPASSAGQIIVVKGKIIKIDNNSGHYQMNHGSNVRIKKELIHRGVEAEEINFGVY